MRCEFGALENWQSDNVGDNKTPSDENDADSQEGISKLESAPADSFFKPSIGCPRM